MALPAMSRRRSTPRLSICRATCNPRPSFRKSNPAATPIMILALTSDNVPPSAIYDAADSVVAQRLAQGRTASPRFQSMAPSNLRSGSRSIRSRSPRWLVHGGRAQRHCQHQCGRPHWRVRWRGRAITIGTNDQLRTVAQYDPLVVRTANGTVVRLSAIASIEAGVRNSRSFGWSPTASPRSS